MPQLGDIMLRDHIARQTDQDPHFQWRGENVTRIENLSDIVFALAFGMLVSASTPPTTYSELLTHLWLILPVIAGFSILVLIWNAHYMFFRRYGLTDATVVLLNAALLLLVLFIAYPLRFIFDGLFGYLLGAFAGDWSRMAETGMGFSESSHIIAIFSIGYATVFLVIALMYGHALKRKDTLGLNATELALTRRSVWHYWIDVPLGLLVAIFAVFTPLGPFSACLLGLSGASAFWLRLRFPLPTADDGDQVSVETSSQG
jgi:hypothetical protein